MLQVQWNEEGVGESGKKGNTKRWERVGRECPATVGVRWVHVTMLVVGLNLN